MGSFCRCKNYLRFFCKNISKYGIFNDQSFKDTLTNGIVSFEQLGPDIIKERQVLQLFDRNSYFPSYLYVIQIKLAKTDFYNHEYFLKLYDFNRKLEKISKQYMDL